MIHNNKKKICNKNQTKFKLLLNAKVCSFELFFVKIFHFKSKIFLSRPNYLYLNSELLINKLNWIPGIFALLITNTLCLGESEHCDRLDFFGAPDPRSPPPLNYVKNPVSR